MRRLHGILFAISALSATGIAHAAARWTEGTVKVGSILWRPDVKGFYAEAGTFLNPDGCNNSGSSFYEISSAVTSDSERNRLLSMLLAAKTDGSRLNIWVDGCGSIGPLFTGLQLNP